jgi:hypothetical protein
MRGYYYDFFSYTTSVDKKGVTNGVLSTVDGATTNNCKQGAFLRETGRRLYPGANPGVSTMLVSVFDFKTGLTGFIDPNSEAFTPQNSDRAYYIDSAGYNPNSSVSSDLRSDQGPPVYTHGDVLADGDMYIGGNASTMGSLYVQGNLNVDNGAYIGGQTYFKTLTESSIGPGSNVPALQNIDCSLGNMWLFHVSSGSWSVNATNVVTGQPIYVYFSTTGSADPGALGTVTLGTNVREAVNTTNGNPITLGLMSTNSILMSFLGVGTQLAEMSRTYLARS